MKTKKHTTPKKRATEQAVYQLPNESPPPNYLMHAKRSNPANPRAELSQVTENLQGANVSPLLRMCLDICAKEPETCPDWAVCIVVGTYNVASSQAWRTLGAQVSDGTEVDTGEPQKHPPGEVWSDQFAKIDIRAVLDACKSAGIWHFPDDTVWVDWTQQDSSGCDIRHTDPLRAITDIEELDVLTSVDPAVATRLEEEHQKYTGRRMPWTVCHAYTTLLSPRVFWLPDPAGGAILYAQTRARENNEPGTGLAVAVFPTMRADWERFANATNFTENVTWRTPDFPQSDSHPVVSVSYLDVQKYLKWANSGSTGQPEILVPAEPDWLQAATNGDGRTYPWGEQDPSGPIGEELLQWSGYVTKSGTSSVYAHWRGCAPTGIHDMAGNTWEWTSTVHES